MGFVGGEFFPVTDESEFNVSLDTPPGSNLEYTKVKAEEVARIARSKPEVIYTYTTIGGQTGSVDEGTVYVRLKPKHDRERSQNDVAAGLRAELARLAGATASITTSGFGDQKQILIQVTGPRLARAAEGRRPGAGRWCRRCPARSTSISRRAARSRSSRSSSIARWPARSA